MRKVLFVIIVLSIIYAQKSAAQLNTGAGINNNLSKQVAAIIDNANTGLSHGDTVKAVALIKRSETYLPKLPPKAAMSLKNKITTFYVSWVKMRNPPSRGAPDEREEQINGLVNRLNVTTIRADQEKAFFSNAVKLAAISKNKPFYIYAKTGYAESLINTGQPGGAIPILDSLSTEPSLSDYEKMHILSLIIINTVKLDQQKNLDPYYNQLQAVNKASGNKLDRKEYMLAASMYQEHIHFYSMAILGYRTLLAQFGKSGHYDEQLTEGMIRLAAVFGLTQKRDSAIFYFNKAHQIIKNNTGLKEAALLYKQAHDAFLKGSNKANKSASSLSGDTVYMSKLADATKQLEYRYRSALQDQQLKLISQQRQLESLKYTRDRQQFILIILSLFVLVIAAGASSYLFYQRRKQLQVLHKAEVENIKQSHHIEVINVLAKSQEEERNRIAGQLHDEVGSMLSVARLNLSVIADYGENQAAVSPEQLAAANSILGDVAATIREMSHELMPVAIRKLGFKKSILQLIDDINTSNKISINCVIVGLDDNDRYPLEFQTNIYRIIQELLQNIIKHSQANHAAFQLVEHIDTLNMMIEDDGIGIDPDTYKDGKGINLLSKRVDLYHGKITIEAGGENGVLIIIDIPLQNVVYSGWQNEPEFSETIPG
jgi:signal transduction histidine kinase